MNSTRKTAEDGGLRGMTRISDYPRPMSTTQTLADAPKESRRDCRAAVAALVGRLTIRMMDVGAGVASRDSYVLNTRKAISSGKAAPVQMVTATAYDDVMHKGRPAHEVKSWLMELCEEIDCWEAERDGLRLSPPDLTPLLRIEQREEGRENQATIDVLASPDCPEVLERFVAAVEKEIDAEQDVVALARKKLTLHRRSRSEARAR